MNDYQTYLITGASKGIGREVAIRLATQDKTIGLVARSEEELCEVAKEIESKGAKARVYPADLTETGVCHQLINELHSEWGHIDVLFNNAGFLDAGSVAELDLEKFDQMLDLNVRAMVHLSRRCAELMVDKKKGAIINLASIAGVESMAGLSGYCATKFAARAFSEATFKDVRKYGIKVSAICPGYVATNMSADFDLDSQKMIQPCDIADAVEYILKSSHTACPREIHIMPQQEQ